MKKKLVFHFYIDSNWRTNPIYNLHFKCLRHYRDCFDEAYFAICPEVDDDYDSIKEVEQKLFNIFNGIGKLEFDIVKNTTLRECPTLKREVVDKLGEDDLVFFAHSKGVSDLDRKTIEQTTTWVSALYYQSLSHLHGGYDDIVHYLEKEPFKMSYGSLMVQFTYHPHINSKYEWYYAGTFFWINSKKLKRYIRNNNITLPEMSNRYYSENFLGDIFPIKASIDNEKHEEMYLAWAKNGRYILCSNVNGAEIEDFMAYGFENEDDRQGFYNFLDYITNLEE